MKKICRDCLNVIEENEEFKELGGEEYLCQHCFEENYFECSCGEIERLDYGYWVDSEEQYICQGCYDNYYTTCYDCNEVVNTDNTYYVENLDRDICQCCRDNGDYYYCSGCGDLFHIDDLSYCERENGYYCNNCYPEEDYSDDLLDYHAYGKNDFTFYKMPYEENPREYYGNEVETEPLGYVDISGVIAAINNNINAVPEEDGSLCYGGVEVVSHPETWDYKVAHKEDYKNFFNELKNLNYGNNGGAGLHFHVSRPQNEDVITRILVIMESFKEEIKKLSRRGNRFYYCQFITDSCYSDEKYKYQSTKYLKENYIKERHDRYSALNLNNNTTIEFRFFNGANNFEEFWSSLQFIHNLMDIAYSDKELNEIQWKDLLQGEELIAQAIKQGVNEVDKTALDTTAIFEKIEIAKQEMKEEIKKTLGNFVKYINRQISNIDISDIKSSKVEEIKTKSNKFLRNIQDEVNFLQNIINFYDMVENYSVDNIKLEIKYLKQNTLIVNNKKYNRYIKLMEKSTQKYESEVVA